MKTILVPIDYSRDSQNALSFALETARLTGAEIILFHAFFPITSPPAAYDVADVVLALEEGRTKDLAAFATTTVQELIEKSATTNLTVGYDQVSIRSVAKMGTPFKLILKALDKYKVDLVIMGMQGGGSISQAVLGSTTLSVMQASLVPVLAIPKGVSFTPVKSVVFAVNLNKLPAAVDLHLLREFLLVSEAKLHLLHLYRNNSQQVKFDARPALKTITEKLEGVPYKVSFDVAEDVAAGIQQFIQEKAADLLVLLPQKHNFIEKLLDRSVTGRITAHPLVPLLALPFGSLPPVAPAMEQEVLAG
ncbi:universal stress protein [Pontibacter roseus]|uniref:universal stress protein n=1 Tax=Pontibacter roseus TaxID=336989 RepID=UPI000379C78D|nr:universal stress protein [Pontibacter roseus]